MTAVDLEVAGTARSAVLDEAHVGDIRGALGTISLEHGLVQEIDLFPAIPAPVAVLCGRERLPKVHPRFRVHDYDAAAGGFNFKLMVQ